MPDATPELPPDDLACREVVEMVTDYFERALPADQADRLERHLDACPGCSEYLEQMRTLAGSLGGVAVEELPVEMRDKLLAAFREARRP